MELLSHAQHRTMLFSLALKSRWFLRRRPRSEPR